MKRPFHILAALLAGVLMLTGCQSSTQKTAEPVARVKIADLLPEKSVPPSGSKKKKFDQVSFDMPLKWREQNTGTNTAYIDDDTHCAYMYCGCSNDKWLTPEEILAQYLEKTEGSPVTVQELSKNKKDKNGVVYRTAAIKYHSGRNVNMLMFIFSPDNKLFWILKGETVDEVNSASLLEGLNGMADSALFSIKNKDKNVLFGQKVIVSGLDNYTIEFHKDGVFLLYTDIHEITSTCTSGKFKIYRGKEAIKYLVGLDQGFSESELTARIKEECTSYNGLYAVVLTVEEVWRYGYQANTKEYERLYTGTLRPDGKLDMYDHLQYFDLTWTPKEALK